VTGTAPVDVGAPGPSITNLLPLGDGRFLFTTGANLYVSNGTPLGTILLRAFDLRRDPAFKYFNPDRTFAHFLVGYCNSALASTGRSGFLASAVAFSSSPIIHPAQPEIRACGSATEPPESPWSPTCRPSRT